MAVYPRATILLVEDDEALATMLVDRLRTKAYCVWHALTAAEAEAMADEVDPDIVIMELMLPDTHGLILCATFKERHRAPIILCSGRARKEDPVIGLKLGADDYIAKPFSLDELEARIEAVLRRTSRPPAPVRTPRATTQQLGTLLIDRARCRVSVGDHVIWLTPTEYKLLCELATHADEVVPRSELFATVWGDFDGALAHSMDVHLRRLRAKLKVHGPSVPTVVNHRGFGYRLAFDRQLDVDERPRRRPRSDNPQRC
jgi:DNA-binding response OmpR family regulator